MLRCITSPTGPALAVILALSLPATARAADDLEDPNRIDHVRREFSWVSPAGHEYSFEATLSLERFERDKELLLAPVEVKFREAVRFFDEGWQKAFRDLAAREGEDLHVIVVSWVQSIPYKTSPEPGLLPSMTLLYGQGDCDDVSILAAGALRALGYDVVLWNVVGGQHMGIGIAIDGAWGIHVEEAGTKYFFWEMTNPHPLGTASKSVKTHGASLISPAADNFTWTPTQAKRHGAISVRSVQSGVDIYINGNRVGQIEDATLLVEDVPPGIYRVEAKKEGFKSSEKSVKVSAGKTAQVKFKLETWPEPVPTDVPEKTPDPAGSTSPPGASRPTPTGNTQAASRRAPARAQTPEPRWSEFGSMRISLPVLGGLLILLAIFSLLERRRRHARAMRLRRSREHPGDVFLDGARESEHTWSLEPGGQDKPREWI